MRAVFGKVDSANGEGHRKSGGFISMNRHYLGFLLHRLGPYRHYLGAALFVSIPLAAVGVVLPYSFNRITQLFSENAGLKQMLLWMVIGLGSVSLKGGLELINKYMLTSLHVGLTNDIRNEIYTQVQNSPLSFHVKKKIGQLSSLMSNDTQVAAGGVIEIYSSIWQCPATIACLLVTMFYFNPVLSIFALGYIPALSFVITKTGNKSRRVERSSLEQESKLLGLMVESLTNVKQVKALGLENLQKDNIAHLGQSLLKLRKKVVLLKSIASPISELLNLLAIITMTIIAYYQLESGQTSLADIAGCLAAAFGLRTPVKSLSNSLLTIQRSVAAMQRITWICGHSSFQPQPRHKIKPPVKKIELENVSFSYDGKQPILKNISFNMSTGERMAIYGPSGSGKTTLIDLIIGFYPCNSGVIRANSIPLDTLDLKIWREQVGIVTQEPFLFDSSIRENIRYGYPSADSNQISEAARLAGCSEILSRLPNGLNTRVGERGKLLSGGERKRIAIARAIVRPISLLVLDEATSELDSHIEEEILTAVDHLSTQLIVIHVSHRPSVLRHSDRTVMLGAGKAVVHRSEDLVRDQSPINAHPMMKRSTVHR